MDSKLDMLRLAFEENNLKRKNRIKMVRLGKEST